MSIGSASDFVELFFITKINDDKKGGDV